MWIAEKSMGYYLPPPLWEEAGKTRVSFIGTSLSPVLYAEQAMYYTQPSANAMRCKD